MGYSRQWQSDKLYLEDGRVLHAECTISGEYQTHEEPGWEEPGEPTWYLDGSVVSQTVVDDWVSQEEQDSILESDGKTLPDNREPEPDYDDEDPR